MILYNFSGNIERGARAQDVHIRHPVSKPLSHRPRQSGREGEREEGGARVGALAQGHAIPKSRTKTAEEKGNEALINSLYASIALGDHRVVQAKLMPEIEWWFHGPPRNQHMKALLAGDSPCDAFHFLPSKLGLLSDKVFVEGHGRGERTWWVHVWTVSDGRVTQLREYSNTAILVKNFHSDGDASASSASASASGDSGHLSASATDGVLHPSVSHESVSTDANVSPTLWQNSLSTLKDASIPGIILVIEGLPS